MAGANANRDRVVLENVKVALAAAGATLNHMVKITVFMTDISQRRLTSVSNYFCRTFTHGA